MFQADECAPDEIEEVKECITKLRNEVQEALAKQDGLIVSSHSVYVKVAVGFLVFAQIINTLFFVIFLHFQSNIQEVILDQFPELVLEYADLGIKTSAVSDKLMMI